MITTRIEAHSSAEGRNGLCTFVLIYPRFIHAEFMTHRCFSRNAASSRAIPISRMIRDVIQNPACPEFWGVNKSGMQAVDQLVGFANSAAKFLWTFMRWFGILGAWLLWKVGVHKQIANRLLEPWSHITVIATASDRGLRNFFALRAQKDAQPEFQVLGYRMLRDWLASKPIQLRNGEWHMPFAQDLVAIPNLSNTYKLQVATGRIARVSYLTHDGKRDPIKDIELHDQLFRSGHWSPFEHCARVEMVGSLPSNLGPYWTQYRKTMLGECKGPSNEELAKVLEKRPTWFNL